MFWRITCALALYIWATILMNFLAFPQFDITFSYARDISVTANALMLMIIGAIATFRPRALHARVLDVCTAICLGAGAILLAIALSFPGLPLLLTFAASVFALGRAGLVISLGLSLSRLPRQKIAQCVGIAFTASGITSVISQFIPIWAGTLCYIIAPLLAFALVVVYAQPILDITSKSEAPADIAVTRPSTFLPLQSDLFICIFLFSVAFGFSLRFGEPKSSIQTACIELIPPLVIALYIFVKGQFNANKLMSISVICMTAGFFISPYQTPDMFSVGNTIMSMGHTVFEMTLWFLLACLASKNKEAALASFSWGFGTSAFGSLLGALIGSQGTIIAGTQSTLWIIFCTILLVVFLSFVLIRMAPFSIQQSIDQVNDPQSQTETSISKTTDKDTFDARCNTIAKDAGLTPREVQVFKMLARGRDRIYIQNELVISKNTVKAHVKHVYSKLGIHSHQQLIDLVDKPQLHAERQPQPGINRNQI